MDLTWSYLANMGRNNLTDHLEEFYTWVMYETLDVRSWLVMTHIVKSHIRRRAFTLKHLPWDPWGIFCSWRSAAPYFVSNGHCSWHGARTSRAISRWNTTWLPHCYGARWALLLHFVLRHCVILFVLVCRGLRSRFNTAKSYAPDIVYANLRGASDSQSNCLNMFQSQDGCPKGCSYLQVPSWGSSFASYWLPERGPGLSLLVPCRLNLDEKQLLPKKTQTWMEHNRSPMRNRLGKRNARMQECLQ